MKIRYLAVVIFSTLFVADLKAQVKKPIHHSNTAVSVARGKIVYGKICLACHMADGNGVPMMNPPLVNTTYVLGDKEKLITIVLNGFKEDVEINGQTYSNVMTPHKDLTDQQIADVLTYVRHSFGNKASAVKVSDVKKVRVAGKG